MSFSYKVFSDYSIQEAYGKVTDLVDKAFTLKLGGIALTDHHSISGIPEFLQSIDKKNAKSEHKVRGVAGCTLNVSYEGTMGTLTVLCKNLQGWKDLIKIIAGSKINEKTLFVNFDDMKDLGRNLIVIHGGLGSLFSKLAFRDYYKAYIAKTREEIELNEVETIRGKITNINSMFANSLYSIEDCGLLCDGALSWMIEKLGGKSLKTRPVYYVDTKDRSRQQAIICAKCKTTIKDPETVLMGDNYRYFWETESNSLELTGDQNDFLLGEIEDFKVSAKPKLPNYSNPAYPNTESYEILADLCRKGWVKKGLKEKFVKHPELKEIYAARIQEELALFKETGLSDYILLIHDFAHFIRSNGASCGLRGSAVGLFISYLLGVSNIDCLNPDPTLPYNKDRELLLSRFYNKWRNTKDNISLPDIDLDMPILFRQNLINFCVNKYGRNNVAHIITFLRMDGKMALKEAFRILDNHSSGYQLANTITSYLIDKAKVQDELQDLQEDDPKYNILKYNIDNVTKIKEYSEEYPEEFALASDLTDTIRAQGKHAAGIVISPDPMADSFPVTIDLKTGEPIVGLEMEFAEYCGAVKYDFLGVAAYDKIDVITRMINENLKEPPMDNYSDHSEEEDII